MKINKDYLVTDTNKHGGKRRKPITVIVPHHNAGVAEGKNIANFFKTTKRQASAHYVIGQQGEVFQTLDESLEPYTTGNRDIDTRAITFEVANSEAAPNWEISDAAFKGMVDLTIDTCKRNGIKELIWTGDRKGNVHLHEWYQNTNCPGPYIKELIPEYVRLVNIGLNSKPTVKPPTKPSTSNDPKGTYKEHATFICKEAVGIIVRDYPSTKSTEIPPGLALNKKFDYDRVFIGNGFVWVSDGVVWIPTGVAKNGKRDGKVWGTFVSLGGNDKKPTKPTKLTEDQIARHIAFEKHNYGNNPGRETKLRNEGYNPDRVQAKINALLK